MTFSNFECQSRLLPIPEDLEYLIYLTVTGEKWVASHNHFGKDATDRPHVNSGGVMSGPEEDFGCAIPQCYYLKRPNRLMSECIT